jgi:hypothetical protein
MTRVALARAYVVLFIVSTAFPVAASLMPEDAVSRVMGVLDVTVAFVLVATGITIISRTPPASPETDRRAVGWYRHAGTVPIVLLITFFLAGSHVRWDILLIGLAWRAWLLLYTLPAALALLRSEGRPD